MAPMRGRMGRSSMKVQKDMDAALLPAVSALAGSVIGGLTSSAATWLSARSHAKAGHLAREMSRREDLFRDFILEASKCYGEALMNSEPRIDQLVALYGLISRMRVLCSSETVGCAERLIAQIVDTYFSPNRTIREIHDLIKNGQAVDPLKLFSEAARAELEALTSHSLVADL